MLKYKNRKPHVEGVLVDDIIKTHQTPLYVYSQKSIIKSYKELKQTLNSEIFYAVKANSNLAIIKLLSSLGAGADVVSVGELKRALAAGVDPKKIIFEGVGKSYEDILFAIKKNIRLINIESVEEIQMINEIGKSINKIINTGIRLNPNIDGNMLDKISTGKNTDKFGITVKDLNDIVLRIKDLKNIKIVGISCHVGSQIKNLNVFKKIFQFMKKTAKELINKKIPIKYVDLGGGIGIKYQSSDSIIKLDSLRKLVASEFKNVPYKISFEPGRYLVANSGILITKILTVKSNGGINYLITDAGMNTLIRPALYNATHIIKSTNLNNSKKFKYTIAGPICESSDIFAKNISLPKQKSGNHLIIFDVGAYGSVMASRYNSRDLPLEILVNDSSLAIIHKPQLIDDYIKQDIVPSWI